MPPMLRTAVSTPTFVAALYERRTNNATVIDRRYSTNNPFNPPNPRLENAVEEL
jgi:hypothetical protein